MRPITIKRLLLFACAYGVQACQGGASAPPAGPGAGGATSTGGSNAGMPPVTPAGLLAAPATGRRLTRTEYLNTLSDVLGVDTAPLMSILPDDGGSSGFRNAFAALLPSATRTDAYEQAALHIAATLPASTLARFGTCQDLAEPCTTGYVTALGRELYRRPLSATEAPRLAQLFSLAQSQGDGFEVGARLVVQAMLQSPAFLYRLERADRVEQPGGLGRVDGFEMASRLSFLLWQSAPDATLLDSAAAGGLEAPGPVVEQMLASPKARRGLGTFFDEWLALYKLENTQRDVALYPGFTPALAQAMRQETHSFLEQLVFDERAPFTSAYTRQTSSFGPELAAHYGVAPPAGAHDWSTDATRGGLLAQAGVLTAHTIVDSTSIVDRGLFVLRTLLCSDVPPPPANAAERFAKVDATLPQRERFAQHRVDPACGACHAIFDPLGNPFEAYDAVGRFQTTDAYGNPIRVDGSFTLDGVEQTYQSLEEFSAKLGASPTTEACLVQQLTRYAFGRSLQSEDDALVSELSATFRDRNLDFLALTQALALSTPYRYVPRDELLAQEAP